MPDGDLSGPVILGPAELDLLTARQIDNPRVLVLGNLLPGVEGVELQHAGGGALQEGAGRWTEAIHHLVDPLRRDPQALDHGLATPDNSIRFRLSSGVGAHPQMRNRRPRRPVRVSGPPPPPFPSRANHRSGRRCWSGAPRPGRKPRTGVRSRARFPGTRAAATDAPWGGTDPVARPPCSKAIRARRIWELVSRSIVSSPATH